LRRQGESGWNDIMYAFTPAASKPFAAGYAQMPSPTSSRWLSEVPRISKPFTRSQLYDAVMQVLDPHQNNGRQ
jgi:hypothetical protein